MIDELNNKYKDKSCFIIGGGYSLKETVDDLLITMMMESRLTLGVNLAYKWFTPSYLVIGDDYFWLKYIKDLEVLNCQIFVPDRFSNYKKYSHVIPIMKSYNRKELVTYSFLSPFLIGSNTGLLALRIAYALGCNPIYLLGIDLRIDLKQTHWHSGYPDPERHPKQERYNIFVDDWRKTILLMQEPCINTGDKGRDIISCSAVSILNDILPYQSLWSVLYQ